MLRNRYAADMSRRFRVVKRLTRVSLVENDALGLGELPRGALLATQPLPPQGLRGLPDERKVAAFMAWFRRAVEEATLESSGDTPSTWQRVYVRASYMRGVEHALNRLRDRPDLELSDVLEEHILRLPLHRDRIDLLAARNFLELKGATEATAQAVARELAEGLAMGVGPPEVARGIAGRIDSIGFVRARTIARTEMIRAHAEASLNTYEQLDIREVEVLAEFSTAADDRVCPECEALEGRIFTVEEARGLIPVHPNCRCAWLPMSKRNRRAA